MASLFDIADPERRLALVYAPRDRRNALALLWVLDERLGAIVRASRETMLGEIRLAWWREALAQLDQGAPKGEPLLEGLADVVRGHGIDPARFSAITEGWAALLGPMPLSQDALMRHARQRGGMLFAIAADLLGAGHEGVEEAGGGWALTDLAFHLTDAASAAQARAMAAGHLNGAARGRWPRRLRPLAILTKLARRDSLSGRDRRQGSPTRLARAIWAGLTGC